MNQQTESKNLVLTIVLTILIIGGWHYFYDVPQQKKQQTIEHIPEAKNIQKSHPSLDYSQKYSTLIQGDPQRIPFENASVIGSINLRGGTFDHLLLKKYKTAAQENAPMVQLWNAQGLEQRTFVSVTWHGPETPNMETLWETTNQKLTPSSPVTLSWTSPKGAQYQRKISLDPYYLITIEDSVINQSNETITLHAEANIYRLGMPSASKYAVLHEGPIAHFEHKLHEVDYQSLSETSFFQQKVDGGWIGYSDQYWLSALIPSQTMRIQPIAIKTMVGDTETYVVGYKTEAHVLAPGANITVNHFCYGGAKVVQRLDEYEAQLHVEHLDKAVDFGWLYFITKPVFYFLAWLENQIGNFGIAILVLTILVKLLFFPLANKSYRSMGRMRQLQPKITALQERFQDDKMQQQQQIMALYKKEKINPLAGCLPMIIQIPIFFSLYKVLFIAIEMRHAPFFLWIHDLAAPDPTTLFNLFGLIPWDPPSFLMIGVWPLIMGGTMLLQQKLSPAPTDPAQAKVFLIMPVIFTGLFASFPAGLVIYWAWSNILSIIQQWWMMRS